MTTAAVIPVTSTTPPRAAREQVLIELCPDGFVRVFGDRARLDVHIAQALDVLPESEALAEQYLDATLPSRFRDLHYPNKIVATGQVRRVTAQKERDRREKIDLIRLYKESRE